MKAWVQVALCCLCFAGCDSDEEVGRPRPEHKDKDTGGSPDSRNRLVVIPPTEGYAGKALGEWAVEYARWANSQSSCASPVSDSDGSGCAMYQEDSDSPVFFFERSDYGEMPNPPLENRTQCRVPAGKAIFVPIAAMSVDNMVLPEELPKNELEQIAVEAKATMRMMIVKADGVEISSIEERGIGPVEFDYHVPPEPNFFSCNEVEGVGDEVIGPSFLSGYFAMIEPPSPGRHELEYASTLTYQHGEYAFHLKTSFMVEDATE